MSMTTDASLDTEVTMSNEQRLNLYVRTILCGVECIPNRELDNIARNFKCGVSSSQDGKMTTWVPKLCLPVLLVGTDTKENLVITCKTGAAYKLSDVFQIPPLPKNVVLVGNCTLDYDDTFKVLIYDGDNLPRPEVDKKSVEPSSLERYSLLRDFYPRYFGDLASSTFVLQWVGYYESACAFVDGKFNVGHEVGGLISTTESAMRPTRPVAIKIPNISIKRFRN
jgi:hypothetical protein